MGNDVVAARPHPVLEAVAGALIPHRRRDEILGDLCERYTSVWRYMFDALQVVPAVVLSETLRSFSRHGRHVVARHQRERRGIYVSAMTARVSAWLVSASPVGRRSLFGLLATAAWFTVTAVQVRLSGADPNGRSRGDRL